jgi:alcohol dehydrogenase class IV
VTPDVIVSFGGGSVNDTARGLALGLSEGITHADQFDDYAVRFRYPNTLEVPVLRNEPLPQIGLPTTLSAAEYTPAMGITSEAERRKYVYQADSLGAAAVLLDPDLTRATPDRLWCATGMKAMSDAIEQIYSRRPNVMVEALALRAVRWFYRYLPPSIAGPSPARDQSRLRCLLAAWFVNSGMFQANTMVGVGAGLRHQLGAMFDIPHGEASCVLLPHVLRFNAQTVPDRYSALAEAFGIEETDVDTVDGVIERVTGFVERLGLPSTLGALGVSADKLRAVAEYTMEDATIRGNPRDVEGPEELVSLLEEAL